MKTKNIKIKTKAFMGQDLRPDCDIKLVSCYQYLLH